MAKTTDQLIEDEKKRLSGIRRRIGDLQRRKRAEQRRRDTRRRIVAGGMLLADAEKSGEGPRRDETLRDWMTRRLGETLKRSDERELFGLEPLAENAGPDADGRTPGAAGISVEDGRIQVDTPARSAAFAEEFRRMGGGWDKQRQLWTGVPADRLDDVAELARRCFETVSTT